MFLATPHSLHIRQIEAVAALGKPVWSEKPLALTRREAERAIAATTRAKVPFALGNNKRCFSSMRELKRVVADGSSATSFTSRAISRTSIRRACSAAGATTRASRPAAA